MSDTQRDASGAAGEERGKGASEGLRLALVRIERAARVLEENARAEGHEWEADDAHGILLLAQDAIRRAEVSR